MSTSPTNTASILKPHITSFLHRRDPPKTFCPSEVARALSPAHLHSLGCQEWRDAMPLIREVIWEMRADGACEVTQKGEALGEEVGVGDVKGPIRVRRAAG
ncbi:uncharacterized protein RCC_08007 [Ramularia collo-cygni]|uniref:DUF3253 domain-containing protein n=1 Tax=Ramularia collo-cygni TaxID=112498 RepID=A0A2D3V2U2_9PEZI|nr:uncharacterized protein RCC_08007 [Ramularia collo-cygni]CZT22138.1 uncharacterized protein RCC_08007 [Ramularia collo-cygni]